MENSSLLVSCNLQYRIKEIWHANVDSETPMASATSAKVQPRVEVRFKVNETAVHASLGSAEFARKKSTTFSRFHMNEGGGAVGCRRVGQRLQVLARMMLV